jgi:hypothetical protein
MSEAARILFGDGDVDEVDVLEDVVAAAEDADGDVDAAAGEAEEGEALGDDDADGEGEVVDPPVEGEDVEVDPPVEAALRFANQQEAERAYAEAQARMNHLQNQLQFQNQQAPVQPVGVEIDYNAAFAQNPMAAFTHALENSPETASQIIARVKMDTAQLMSQSMIAQEEGDDEGANRAQQQAYNAAMLEQQMTESKIRSEYEASLAPTREREFTADLSAAADRATRGIDGAELHQEAVTALISANPHLMGDWSPSAMEQGFSVALSHVMRQAPQNIDDIVAAKVAEALAGKKAASKQRASGGGAGRRGPSTSSTPDEDEGEDIASSLMPREHSGMSILFGA